MVSAEHIPGVLDAYNYAITRTFYVATSVAAVAFLLSLGIRWRSVKPNPQPAVSDEEARSSSQQAPVALISSAKHGRQRILECEPRGYHK